MTMSNCKECGKAVSTLAKTCPSCGAPNPTLKKLPKQTVMYFFSNKAAYINENIENQMKDLILVFWGLYVGGNVVGNLLLFWIEKGLFFKIIFGVVIIWNLICIYFVLEAAQEYKATAIHNEKTYGWATAAQIAVVFLTLSAIGNSL